jgi:hypothetical protein
MSIASLPKPIKPRLRDDEAIAEMCKWLKARGLIALGTRRGQLVIMDKPPMDEEGLKC